MIIYFFYLHSLLCISREINYEMIILLMLIMLEFRIEASIGFLIVLIRITMLFYV